MTAHPATPAAERPERTQPTPNGLTGVGVIVVAPGSDRILLGLGHDGRWELPGGKVDPGESFEEAAVRELAEETSLHAGAAGVRIVAVLMDGARGVTRVTAAAVLETPRVRHVSPNRTRSCGGSGSGRATYPRTSSYRRPPYCARGARNLSSRTPRRTATRRLAEPDPRKGPEHRRHRLPAAARTSPASRPPPGSRPAR